jgi:hypothetical protein
MSGNCHPRKKALERTAPAEHTSLSATKWVEEATKRQQVRIASIIYSHCPDFKSISRWSGMQQHQTNSCAGGTKERTIEEKVLRQRREVTR